MVSMDNKDENINMEHNITDSNSGTQDQQPRPVRPGSEGERPVRMESRPRLLASRSIQAIYRRLSEVLQDGQIEPSRLCRHRVVVEPG